LPQVIALDEADSSNTKISSNMAHLTDKTNAAQPNVQQRATEPSWLWLAGGSIAIHLLALVILLPIVSRASMPKKNLEISSIDFVELPSAKKAVSAKKAIAPSAQAPTVPPPAPATQSNSKDIGFVPSANRITPIVEPIVEPSIEPSIEPTIAPAPESPIPESPIPESSSASAASATPSQPSAPAETAQQTAPGQAAPGQAAPEQAGQQTAASAPHQVTTEQITAAIPDTSAQYSGENQPIPLTLTASLQVVAVPPEQLEMPPPDAIAQPLVGSYTFTPNPQDTICVPESEVAQFAAPGGITLGAEVGVQVATNEAGQVIDTAIWQPSQNPLNNQLAACLVKNWNWGFQPAIAQGKPVASKALVIWVKIDRT
jgi:outer membrane biosynthesis protein TonB